MTLERFRALCLAQPGATEQIQWRMDANAPLCSFKCDDETFAELLEREHVAPAPYLARAKWVAVTDWSALSDREFNVLVSRACTLVRAGLSKRLQAALPGGGPSGVPHAPGKATTRRRR